MGFDEYLNAGFSQKDLRPVSMSLDAANKSAIWVDGAFFAIVTQPVLQGVLIST